MIAFIAETGSTSADLAARLTSGERVAEGEWLVADRQIAGRGRRGRTWFDHAGNFMGSTIVQLQPGDPAPETLALLTALAVYTAVVPHVPQAALKWPNDLMVGSAKLSGILLERVGEAVVVGIGVNLATAPVLPDRVTAAIAEFGQAAPRDSFARTLASAFATELERWRTAGLAPIIRRWLAAAHPPGTALVVDQPDGSVSGRFETLADDGALLLRLPDGSLRAVRAGEVRFAHAQVQD